MQHLFSSHSFGTLMTNDKSGKNIGKTALSYLKQITREIKYKRKKEIKSKYLIKGNQQEENAIDLLSISLGKFLTKNTTRLNNEFITGEPDLFVGENIIGCKEGFDTKCSWDLFTFPFKDEPLDSQYFYQNMCYMWLTGAEKWTTAYCLVNTPWQLIDKEKKSLFYDLNCPDEHDEFYQQRLIEIEKNHIFDFDEFEKENPYYDLTIKNGKDFNIPISERILLFTIERDENIISNMKNRAILCQGILAELLK